MADNTSGFISQMAVNPQAAGNLVASLTATNAGALQSFLTSSFDLPTQESGTGPRVSASTFRRPKLRWSGFGVRRSRRSLTFRKA